MTASSFVETSESLSDETLAVRTFLTLSHVAQRDDFLQDSLYWKNVDVHQNVSPTTLLAVVGHINDCLLNFVGGNEKKIGPELLDFSPGLRWSTPDWWGKWQARLLQLMPCMNLGKLQPLLSNIYRYGSVHQTPQKTSMLEHAQAMMTTGMHFDMNCLLRVAYWPLCEHPFPLVVLKNYPLILDALTTSAREEEIVSIVAGVLDVVRWLSRVNPRLDAWRFAQYCTTKNQLVELSEGMHDSALFKAWHGIAPTVEEMQLHPLVQSLYVHKYAPVYLAEVAPLPEHWRLAMDLAGTGEEFKFLLLQGQSQKPPTEMLALPSGFQAESAV